MGDGKKKRGDHTERKKINMHDRVRSAKNNLIKSYNMEYNLKIKLSNGEKNSKHGETRVSFLKQYAPASYDQQLVYYERCLVESKKIQIASYLVEWDHIGADPGPLAGADPGPLAVADPGLLAEEDLGAGPSGMQQGTLTRGTG